MAWWSFCCWVALAGLRCCVVPLAAGLGVAAGERAEGGSGHVGRAGKPGELSGAGNLGQQEVRQMALETRIWSM
jgi:hypothetical protein